MEYLKQLTSHEINQIETKLLKYTGQIAGNGCRYWLGNRNKSGYGMLHLYYPDTGKKTCVSAGKAILALRLRFWPNRWDFACHKCDNPSCANPDHIWQGNPQANHDDMRAKGRGTKGKKIRYHHRVKKYSDKIIQDAKTMLLAGQSMASVARATGMSQAQVWGINHGLLKRVDGQKYPLNMPWKWDK